MLFNYTLLEARILVLKIQILIMITDCDIRKCKISKTWIELFNVCATSTMLAQTKLLCWTIGLIWLMFLKLEISSERHLGGGLKELWTKYLILFLKNSFNSEILTYLSVIIVIIILSSVLLRRLFTKLWSIFLEDLDHSWCIYEFKHWCWL